MKPEQFHSGSNLFTVRLWLQPLGDGQTEWRSKVQHLPSGEARCFGEWSSLVIFLHRTLSETAITEEQFSPQPKAVSVSSTSAGR